MSSFLSFFQFSTTFSVSLTISDPLYNFRLSYGDVFGFLLSALLLISSQNINNSLNITYPLFLLSVPLIDMVYVIFLRITKGVSPFYPDKNHIHHRLLSSGFKVNNTVYLIWSISLITVSIYFFINKILI